MEIQFPFEQRSSSIFGTVWRPIALVDFCSTKQSNVWTTIRMIIDTGADYTLLPRSYAKALGVDLEHDCKPFETMGIGGHEVVFMHPAIHIRLGNWETDIPLGFLDRDAVPPLLGRQHFFELLTVHFQKHITTFQA